MDMQLSEELRLSRWWWVAGDDADHQLSLGNQGTGVLRRQALPSLRLHQIYEGGQLVGGGVVPAPFQGSRGAFKLRDQSFLDVGWLTR